MVELIFDKNDEWEKRVLCSDESCTGTIGSDGKCRECGKAYISVRKDPDIIKADISNDSGVVVADDEWEKRVLCSDESCTGTIGPDGKCRECGKPLQL